MREWSRWFGSAVSKRVFCSSVTSYPSQRLITTGRGFFDAFVAAKRMVGVHFRLDVGFMMMDEWEVLCKAAAKLARQDGMKSHK